MTTTTDPKAPPPLAPRIPFVTETHGDRRVDDYHWLQQKGAPEVESYLRVEDAYAHTMMSSTDSLQERLYLEIVGRIKETDQTAAYREGDFFYYSRTEQGKQYAIHCRRRRAASSFALDRAGPEEILLDLNQLADEHANAEAPDGSPAFVSLAVFTVSDDGRWLAYSVDHKGFRDYRLHVKDLETGKLETFTVDKVKSAAWAPDNRTLFYTEDDATKRSFRVSRHRRGVGTTGAAEPDTLIYEENDERFRVEVERSRSGAMLLLTTSSHTTSEVRFLRADDPAGAFTLVAPRVQDVEYYVDHRGDEFFFLSNDAGRNFRIARAPVATPGSKHWRDVIPHEGAVMRDNLAVFRDHLVVVEREDGIPQLLVMDLATGGQHRIVLPEPLYALKLENNRDFGAGAVRFDYQSLTTPPSVFSYEFVSRQKTLLKRTEIRGGYDPAAYQSQRMFATAADGARIPISLVFAKQFPPGPGTPLLLSGYGAYGMPYPVSFSVARMSLLDRGVTFAIAHVRGGGDLGKPWHDAGRMAHKPNTFSDFIAVAEHLIAQRRTGSDRLAITGGSAGGLLMGAVMNLRPELWKAVVALVPFVDVLNTMLDASLPLTVSEYEEWGNPNIKAEYDLIKTYCPYSNLRPQNYPALLIRTSYEDSQVMYWEPAKFVARLRALKTDANPLLFRIRMAGGGHGGAAGRYDQYREVAIDYAFVLWQLGVWP